MNDWWATADFDALDDGGSVGAGHPRHYRQPTARENATARFWKYASEGLTPEHQVRASRVPLLAGCVVDVMGAPVFEIALNDFKAFLFWVDEEPMANWAHRCRYVLVSENGTVVSVSREWPPADVFHNELDEIKKP